MEQLDYDEDALVPILHDRASHSSQSPKVRHKPEDMPPQQQKLENAYAFDTVGPPATLSERRAYWIDAERGGLFCGHWEEQSGAFARFYERFGVGLLGQHHVVTYDDGFIPPRVCLHLCKSGKLKQPFPVRERVCLFCRCRMRSILIAIGEIRTHRMQSFTQTCASVC